MISCRPIGIADFPAIINLLNVAFPKRGRRYWIDGIKQLAAHQAREGSPCLGYMLVSQQEPVGVILLISTSNREGAHTPSYRNVSSWYVRPDFRAYAPLLVLRATKDASATYINISPADNTVPIIEAQGFKKFCNGVFAALPALGYRRCRGSIGWLPAHWASNRSMPSSDLRLLEDHYRFGCISLWCETADGGQPFVFKRRTANFGPIPMPCAQLIYCRSLEDLEKYSGKVGRFLALRGLPVMLVAADRPLHGVYGRHFPDKSPMYFKGTMQPRTGNLAYTEAAIFGF